MSRLQLHNRNLRSFMDGQKGREKCVVGTPKVASTLQCLGLSREQNGEFRNWNYPEKFVRAAQCSLQSIYVQKYSRASARFSQASHFISSLTRACEGFAYLISFRMICFIVGDIMRRRRQ